ncbi:MAG: hypothetical protein ACYTBV_18655 [Planctomycetota bacterium]|jgi:hypothetical protein
MPISVNAEEKITYVSVFKYFGGIVSGFLIHEGGHALAAELTGTDMEWEWGNINQPFEFTENADSDTDGLIVNSAGFITQAAAAEIILRYDKIDKNDAFVRGIMTWSILNPIFYSIDYWFIQETNNKDGGNYEGDLQGIEHYSDESKANLFAIGIVAIAASQGYRFLKTQTWAPDWISDNSHDLNFVPLGSGGFAMTYKIPF